MKDKPENNDIRYKKQGGVIGGREQLPWACLQEEFGRLEECVVTFYQLNRRGNRILGLKANEKWIKRKTQHTEVGNPRNL